MAKDPVKTYNLIMWIAGLELLLVSFVLMARSNLVGPTDDAIALSAAIGLILYSGNLFYFLGMQKPMLDERTRKIGTTAMTYSWYATFAVLCLLVIFYYESIFLLRLDAGQIFGALLLTMVVSMLAFMTYLNKKGDVE
jgi:hypothetical protein